MKNIAKLINPRSVVVIGASAHPEKVGHQILKNLIESGFGGSIFAVNPEAENILGIRADKSVLEITNKLDLAIIAVHAETVLELIGQCAEKRIPAVIVISAGFAEIGAEGAKLQEELLQLCKKSGITLLGPNCLGLINTSNKLNASFASGMPKTGNVSLLSQSGAIISSLIDWSKNSSAGFSKIFSLGNMAEIEESDILEYLYRDRQTEVIAGYIESLESDQELTRVLIRYAKTKPTILLYGGKSRAGARAAHSHTGSVVTAYKIVETYLRQSGVVVAGSLEELTELIQIFSYKHKMSGKNIAVITNAGGPAIATTDALIDSGLKLAALSEQSKNILKKSLRSETNRENPVDLLGDATEQDYKIAVETVLSDSGVDGAIVLLTPQTATKINEIAGEIAVIKTDKPLISSFIGGHSLSQAKAIIEDSGKMFLPYPEDAVFVLSALAEYTHDKQSLSVVTPRKQELFIYEKKAEILKKFKLPYLEYYPVMHFDGLAEAVKKTGYPLILKSADETIHKSEAGKVVLNIMNDDEIKIAFGKVGAPAIVGKMVFGKLEIMLGIKKDKDKTVILFGTGGIYSEIYADYSYRIAPIGIAEAKKMISETKIGKILSGIHGQYCYDLDRMAEIVVHAAEMADSYSNIAEIDFNPIIANKDGYHIVDTRIILKDL